MRRTLTSTEGRSRTGARPPAHASAVGLFLSLSLAVGLQSLAGPAASTALAQSAAARPGSAAPIVSRPSATPSAKDDPLGFANGLYRAGRYSLAADEYDRFLQANKAGGNPSVVANAWFMLGNSRLYLNKYAEARKAFESFVEVAPDNPNASAARYRIGQTSYVLGDLEGARKTLQAYVGGENGDRRYAQAAWTYLGDIAIRLGDLPEARRSYEKSLEGDDKTTLANRSRLGLGRVLAAQGDTAGALAVLRDLIASDSPEWLDKAWLQVGQVEASAGRWERAAEAFASAEKVGPRGPLVAEARLDRADALARLGKLAEAEAILRPLAGDLGKPVGPPAADALGTLLMLDNRSAEALATLDAALARPEAANSASAPALRFHAAEASMMAGRRDEARERFASIARTEPKSSWADDAQLRAASLALAAGDNDQALGFAGGFAAAFPDSPLKADAHLIEARAALGLGRPRDAIQILNDLTAQDKPGPAVAQAASYYLGLAYAKDGQADKAVASLDQVAQGEAAAPSAAADASYLVGLSAFETGRFAEAIAALDKYLAEKPNGDVADHALARLVRSHAELGQVDQADASFAALESRFPRSPTIPSTRLRLAERALADGRFDRAVELFRPIAEPAAGPDAPEVEPAIKARALDGLGRSLLASKHPLDAARAFEAMLAASPDADSAVDARFALGRAWQDAGRPDKAMAAISDALARHPDAPQAGPSALALARLQVDAGRPADAARSFGLVVDKYPTTSGVPVDAALDEQGWALLDAGQAAEADAVFERLLKDHPDSPSGHDARFNLAESAHQAGDPKRVAELLAPVVADGSTAGPELVERSLYRLGQAEAQGRDWPAASRSFDRLARDFPEGPYRRVARFWRGECAFQSGNAAAAATDFAALAAEPAADDDPKGLVANVRGRLVQSFAQQDRWGDALSAADAWEKAGGGSADDPLGPDVVYARGLALQGKARFDEARESFARVIAAREGSELAARARLMRGETFFHQKKYAEALPEFYRVIVQSANAPEARAAALLEAGKVHEKLDQWAEAVESYDSLIADYPKDRHAEDAARRLEAARAHAGKPGPDAAKAIRGAEPAG